MKGPSLLAVLGVALCGCATGGARPVPVDPRGDTCAWCRMTVSDPRLAAEIVAPGEEPRVFDDIGCLRDYLREAPATPRGAVAFVTDHRTREWVAARRAAYRRVQRLATPMASGLAAWSDDASAAADPEAEGGEPRTLREIFGSNAPPGDAS